MLRPGYPTPSDQAQLALQLIAAFQRSPMAGLDTLQAIDLTRPGLLQVTSGEGAQITFGAVHLARQLRRWRAVYDYAKRSGKQLASLDLSISKNVPLVWKRPPQQTNSDSATLQNSHTGKNNV